MRGRLVAVVFVLLVVAADRATAASASAVEITGSPITITARRKSHGSADTRFAIAEEPSACSACCVSAYATSSVRGSAVSVWALRCRERAYTRQCLRILITPPPISTALQPIVVDTRIGESSTNINIVESHATIVVWGKGSYINTTPRHHRKVTANLRRRSLPL